MTETGRADVEPPADNRVAQTNVSEPIKVIRSCQQLFLCRNGQFLNSDDSIRCLFGW
jgi:hypothetical protein